MILVIDNYDSFTYNLVQFIGELGAEPLVFRNDEIEVAAIEGHSPKGLIVSPGPGRPEDGGVSVDAILEYTGKLPILGVCLGHQSIGAAFGGTVGRVVPLHCKSSLVTHEGDPIFGGIPSPFLAGRYHSLVVEADSIPETLEVTAKTEDGIVMGLKHRDHPTYGVQFHPESILTRDGEEFSGKQLLKNFLIECGEVNA